MEPITVLVSLVRSLLSAFVRSEGVVRDLCGQALLASVKQLVGDSKADSSTTYMTPNEHAAASDKLATIKLIRTRTGLGLKEAIDLYKKFYPVVPAPEQNRPSHQEIAMKLNNLTRLSPDWEDGTMKHNQERGFYLNMRDVARTFGLSINSENRLY